MDLQQVAAAAGVLPETIRHYHKAANKARAEGRASPRDLPPASRGSDGKNYWDEVEIDIWVSSRQRPAKRGAIPKAEMQAVLDAAQLDNIEEVITIARRNLT